MKSTFSYSLKFILQFIHDVNEHVLSILFIVKMNPKSDHKQNRVNPREHQGNNEVGCVINLKNMLIQFPDRVNIPVSCKPLVSSM